MQHTALSIVQKLQDSGHKAYFAGGCVRDLLRNEAPLDYDIATSATPEQIEDLFEKTYDIGKQFGVILLQEGSYHFEVATFRSDSGYSDGRRPDFITFSQPEQDAQRRDFTINGIFYDPVANTYHDFVGGRQDLRRGLLRFIGDPDERILEDHLRILRAVRFRHRFGLEYERKTQQALGRHSSLTANITVERLADELNKILVHNKRSPAFQELMELGILENIIPECTKLQTTPQDRTHHSEGNVWEHTLLVIKHLPPESTSELCWGALLHDIGKADTIQYRDGRIHFYGHTDKGVEVAQKILQRLKFSKTATKKILWLIDHHHIFDQYEKMKTSTKLKYFDHPFFPDLLELFHADFLGSQPDQAHPKKTVNALYQKIQEDFDQAHKDQALPSHQETLLDGREIMELLNLKPGPTIEALKSQIHDLQLEGTLKTRADAESWLKKQALSP